MLPFLFIYYYGSSLSIKCSYTKLFAIRNPICIICNAFICNTFAFDTYPYTHIRELTSMLQTTWASKNPHTNLYGNVPFPLDIQKNIERHFPLRDPSSESL